MAELFSLKVNWLICNDFKWSKYPEHKSEVIETRQFRNIWYMDMIPQNRDKIRCSGVVSIICLLEYTCHIYSSVEQVSEHENLVFASLTMLRMRPSNLKLVKKRPQFEIMIPPIKFLLWLKLRSAIPITTFYCWAASLLNYVAEHLWAKRCIF